MEFPFDINDLLRDEITKLDNRLLPDHIWDKKYPRTVIREYETKMNKILDQLGDASSVAQSLTTTITNTEKMKNSDNILYLMKNGRNAVVGLLKMGRKKLFVYDQKGAQHELLPLSVLDFYIHESMQRQGCGKRLFEHMLQDNDIEPQHLAVDRPSEKFLCFLRRHYNLTQIIPQMNNFVVFYGFFDGKVDWSVRSKRGRQSDETDGRYVPLLRKRNFGIELEDASSYNQRNPLHGRFRSTPVPGGNKPTVAEALHGRNNGTVNSAPHSPPAERWVPPPVTQRPSSPAKSVNSDATSGHEEDDEQKLAASVADINFNDMADGTPENMSPVHRDLKFAHSRLW